MGFIRYTGGKPNMVAPVGGIKASDIVVGSIVKLMENDVATEYLVINQGIPSSSSLYDASCDGMWLLRKDIYENRQLHSGRTTSNYAEFDIHEYLNNTFFNIFGEIEKNVIPQVKIPYNPNDQYMSQVTNLPTKVFLLSATELGITNLNGTGIGTEGAKLKYFESSNANGAVSLPLRIAYLNGTASSWFTRSNGSSSTTDCDIIYVSDTGSLPPMTGYIDKESGIRPALILPSNAIFDQDTLLLKGVA